MNTDPAWFFYDFNPSFQDWDKINKHIEEDLQYEDCNTQSFVQPLQTHDYISCCESYQGEETVECHTSETPKKQLVDNNYEKNICAYISKTIVQHLIAPRCQKIVRRFCFKTGCKYQDAMKYYTKKSKQIFGATHLVIMLSPEHEGQINLKRMFCLFLNWFLRNRYMLYMVKNGKMDQKEKYIEFKNKYLLYIAEVQQELEKYV